MRIAVIGAGNMGSVLGGKLARAAHASALFDRDPVIVEIPLRADCERYNRYSVWNLKGRAQHD
jgi:ketopantoate reductase